MTIEKANGTVAAGNELCRQITGAPEMSADTSTVATAAGTIRRGVVMWPFVPVIITPPHAVVAVAEPVAVPRGVAGAVVSFIASLFD